MSCPILGWVGPSGNGPSLTSSESVVLEGLEVWTQYEVCVVASTVGGGLGNSSCVPLRTLSAGQSLSLPCASDGRKITVSPCSSRGGSEECLPRPSLSPLSDGGVGTRGALSTQWTCRGECVCDILAGERRTGEW